LLVLATSHITTEEIVYGKQCENMHLSLEEEGKAKKALHC